MSRAYFPPSLDEVHRQVMTLVHLLEAANYLLDEQDLGLGGQRNTELDRLASLFAVCQEQAERIDKYIAEHYRALKGGAN